MRRLTALDVMASYGSNSNGQLNKRLFDKKNKPHFGQSAWISGKRAIEVLYEPLAVDSDTYINPQSVSDNLPGMIDSANDFLDQRFLPLFDSFLRDGLIKASVSREKFNEIWLENDFIFKAKIFAKFMAGQGNFIYREPDFLTYMQRISAAATLMLIDEAMEAVDSDAFDLLAEIEYFHQKMHAPDEMFHMIDTAKSIERSEIYREKANTKHEQSNQAKAFVQSEWHKHKVAYDNNKSAFSRDYVKRVLNELNVKVTEKQMKEVWLKDTPTASKPDWLPADG